MSGFSAQVLALLRSRSGGFCEGCRVVPAAEAHHRQYRSRGGADTLSNALHLCGWGNHTGCHGVAHTGLGEARGWSVRSGFVPADVPVLVMPGPRERWRLLNDTSTSSFPISTTLALDAMAAVGVDLRGGG